MKAEFAAHTKRVAIGWRDRHNQPVITAITRTIDAAKSRGRCPVAFVLTAKEYARVASELGQPGRRLKRVDGVDIKVETSR